MNPIPLTLLCLLLTVLTVVNCDNCELEWTRSAGGAEVPGALNFVKISRLGEIPNGYSYLARSSTNGDLSFGFVTNEMQSAALHKTVVEQFMSYEYEVLTNRKHCHFFWSKNTKSTTNAIVVSGQHNFNICRNQDFKGNLPGFRFLNDPDICLTYVFGGGMKTSTNFTILKTADLFTHLNDMRFELRPSRNSKKDLVIAQFEVSNPGSGSPVRKEFSFTQHSRSVTRMNMNEKTSWAKGVTVGQSFVHEFSVGITKAIQDSVTKAEMESEQSQSGFSKTKSKNVKNVDTNSTNTVLNENTNLSNTTNSGKFEGSSQDELSNQESKNSSSVKDIIKNLKSTDLDDSKNNRVNVNTGFSKSKSAATTEEKTKSSSVTINEVDSLERSKSNVLTSNSEVEEQKSSKSSRTSGSESSESKSSRQSNDVSSSKSKGSSLSQTLTKEREYEIDVNFDAGIVSSSFYHHDSKVWTDTKSKSSLSRDDETNSKSKSQTGESEVSSSSTSGDASRSSVSNTLGKTKSTRDENTDTKGSTVTIREGVTSGSQEQANDVIHGGNSKLIGRGRAKSLKIDESSEITRDKIISMARQSSESSASNSRDETSKGAAEERSSSKNMNRQVNVVYSKTDEVEASTNINQGQSSSHETSHGNSNLTTTINEHEKTNSTDSRTSSNSDDSRTSSWSIDKIGEKTMDFDLIVEAQDFEHVVVTGITNLVKNADIDVYSEAFVYSSDAELSGATMYFLMYQQGFSGSLLGIGKDFVIVEIPSKISASMMIDSFTKVSSFQLDIKNRVVNIGDTPTYSLNVEDKCKLVWIPASHGEIVKTGINFLNDNPNDAFENEEFAYLVKLFKDNLDYFGYATSGLGSANLVNVNDEVLIRESSYEVLSNPHGCLLTYIPVEHGAIPEGGVNIGYSMPSGDMFACRAETRIDDEYVYRPGHLRNVQDFGRECLNRIYDNGFGSETEYEILTVVDLETRLEVLDLNLEDQVPHGEVFHVSSREIVNHGLKAVRETIRAKKSMSQRISITINQDFKSLPKIVIDKGFQHFDFKYGTKIVRNPTTGSHVLKGSSEKELLWSTTVRAEPGERLHVSNYAKQLRYEDVPLKFNAKVISPRKEISGEEIHDHMTRRDFNGTLIRIGRDFAIYEIHGKMTSSEMFSAFSETKSLDFEKEHDKSRLNYDEATTSAVATNASNGTVIQETTRLTMAVDDACHEKGIFPDVDCSKYWVCYGKGKGWQNVCEDGQYFYAAKKHCVIAELSDCLFN